MLSDTAARFPDRPAVIDGSTAAPPLSWRKLYAEARRVSVELYRRGVRPGDTVASILGNTREHVTLLHGIWLSGAACAPLNTRLTERERSAQIAHLRPSLLIHEEGFPLDRDMPGRTVMLSLRHMLEATSAGDGSGSPLLRRDHATGSRSMGMCFEGEGRSPAPVGISGDMRCSVLFTSGTSGRAKAVPHSWNNHRASAAASRANLGEHSGDIWQCVIPLYHIGGLAIVVRSLFTGMAVRLHDGFAVDEVLQALRNDSVTITSVVPTMLHRIMVAAPGLTAAELPSLRAVLLGGAAASVGLWDEALRRNFPVLGTYGLTESCAQVATASPLSIREEAQTAGHPLRDVQMEIRDAAGATLPTETEGEIVLRGPMLTEGYLQEVDEQHRAFRDGWFHTGDIGHFDAAGRLIVSARREDVIISGGENIMPSEIESVLLRLEDVADAAVVGVTDAEWGQQVAAALVLRREASIEEIAEACRKELAGYKIPRIWHVMEALPRTASGKIRYAELRVLLGRPEERKDT
ncbi:MAG: o-succinylbenzoate--CoA ligase [Bacteroidetes bacterium]|nr:o-succinylbenzoate--CoA ligase [Bacteroidota bacterium]